MTGARAMSTFAPGWNNLLEEWPFAGAHGVDGRVQEENPLPARPTHLRRGAGPTADLRRPSGPNEEEVRLVVSMVGV